MWERLRSGSQAGTVTVRARGERRRLVQALASALDGSRVSADESALELQPLIRICGSTSYPDFKADQETAWRKQRSTYTTRAWPESIAEGEVAAVLLPIAAGRVGPGVGRNPRALVSPQFSHGRPIQEGNVDDLALGLITTWLGSITTPVRVAPPVIELTQRGQVTERRVVNFGQTWHLPEPDGL